MNARISGCLRCLARVAAVVAVGSSFALRPVLGQAAPPAPDVTPEDEVLANLRNQRIGRTQTVADLNLPESFLRREADRIIRGSFEERYRVVVKDALAITEDGQPPITPEMARSKPRQAASDAIALFEPTIDPQTLAYRRSFGKGRPPNRGFKPALAKGDPLWPFDEPGDDALQSLRDAADLVGKRLAFDGLLFTLVHVVAALGPEPFTAIDDSDLDVLRATGLPIDLLEHFTLATGESGMSIVATVARTMQSSATIDAALKAIEPARFKWRPTQSGFSVADDAGGMRPGVVRAQITRGAYWRGEDDGSTTDLVRKAMAALPETRFVASVELKHARDFADVAATWPLLQAEQLTMVIEPLKVEQWTQDNAKAGSLIEAGSQPRLAMLVPRYASWGDDGSTFLPGESFLLPGAAEALGAQLVHSPLLFQGGNILCVEDSRTQPPTRMLLVADADIYRNTALGLSFDQSLEAFRSEFGCDRCEMIEAVSFHLDYDLSPRATDRGVIAMVNDPLAAAKIVLESGTAALVRAGMADANVARDAIDALRRDDEQGYLGRIAPGVYNQARDGRFPLSMAEKFATSPMDSGIGNLQRFLLALDFLASRNLKEDRLPASRHARSYVQSMARREAERERMHQKLRELGLTTAAIPSMTDATRSMAALNGLQLQGVYIMPAYGGLFAALDAAAKAAVQDALGDDLRIVQITCGESQRRSGAVRCSLSVFPSLTPVANASTHPESQ